MSICLSEENLLPASEATLSRFETKLKYAHFSRILESLEQCAESSLMSPIKVIDLACGPGNMALFSNKIKDIEWFGLELWPNELLQATLSGAYKGLVQANLVDRLPIRAGVADAIVLNEILMYLENSTVLLTEAFNILQSSGMLYVYNPIYTTPTLLSRLKRIGRQIYSSSEAVAFDCRSDWKRASRASRINFYSFDSLLKEIQKAGFKVIEVSGFRIFRNRIRLMRGLEKFQWYREIIKRFAKRNPRWASDILVIAQKP